MIFAPVTAVTLDASDLGRIVNVRDGYPDEKRPFLFSFSKPKVVAAWRKIGAMVLTRACLKHARMREISRRSPPRTKRTKVPLPRPASTTHSRVSSDPHARCAAVNRQRQNRGARPARHHQLEKSVGRLRATAFNSGMAMKAQPEVLA